MDMVSFYDCKTPSEASNILIDIYHTSEYNIKISFDKINLKLLNFNIKYKNNINYLSQNLPLKFSNKVKIYIQKLDKQNHNINSKIISFYNNYKYHVNKIYGNLPLKFSRKKNNYITELETINHKINNKTKYILNFLQNRLALIINNIKLNNPNKILEK
jgi:exonuclease VII large subunit